MNGRVEEFAGEGNGGDAWARRQRREAEEGGCGGSSGVAAAVATKVSLRPGQGVAAVVAAVAATARRRAVAAVVAAMAVGLLPRPSVSSHSRWRRLLSFLK